MVNNIRLTLLTVLILPCLLQYPASAQLRVKDLCPAVDSINGRLMGRTSVLPEISIDTFLISKKNKRVDIRLSPGISDYPLRDDDIEFFSRQIKMYLPSPVHQYDVCLYAGERELSGLSSGYYSGRGYSLEEKSRQSAGEHGIWIKNLTVPVPEEGLSGRNIALWPGHGYYYSNIEDRWKWQRAPFFSTIEDLLLQSYIVSFLAPMLENAGASVLIPRERDMQATEIIVDNGSVFYTERNGEPDRHQWTDAPDPGFADTADCYSTGENPFTMGTARMVECSLKHPSSAAYIPNFPESGDYAVYVSYQTVKQSSSAKYTVRHSGGESEFTVDQSMGGGTWVYLGTFRFTKGETGQGVIVQNCAEESKGRGYITTDAVRFGGGTGNISRGGQTSGVPRYAEAARYWLQWSGFPETIYNTSEDQDDYKDDYTSRGEWVNDLTDRLGIPVDMALALHTDAGVVRNDSIIGTLAIYKEESEGKVQYPDGRPRIMARELADIVQTTLIEDIRTYCREDWTRRSIWDRSYMEARVPDVPTVLIELLSHQNFADMQYALDPGFKFIASRAIYKGILKYLSYIHDTEYTVQPLPVKDLKLEVSEGRKDRARIHLQWSPRTDSTEASAVPSSYIVYRRTADTAAGVEVPGFAKVALVDGTGYYEDILPGRIYSYYVTAVNKGGRSFPSEILSAGYIPDAGQALIVNGFTSVSGPAPMPVCDSVTAGFDFRADHGTPYIQDCSYIGEQFEFLRDRDWIHDDRPGFGASYMDYGPAPMAGNTYDYPLIHGMSLMRSGMSFSSTSLSAFSETDADPDKYAVIDLIFGKQKNVFHNTGPYPLLSEYCSGGGSVIISGANIGKSAWYDSDRKYSGSLLLNTSMSSVYRAAGELETLRDSLAALSSSTASDILSSLDSISSELRAFAVRTVNTLNNRITALHREADPDFAANRLAADIFRYGWSNGSATTTGIVRPVRNQGKILQNGSSTFQFSTAPNPDTYCVESPDAILPSDDRSFTFMRYCGSNTSAAVAYDGDYRAVSLGFPIEALTSQQQVDDLMREVIRFLLRD